MIRFILFISAVLQASGGNYEGAYTTMIWFALINLVAWMTT